MTATVAGVLAGPRLRLDLEGTTVEVEVDGDVVELAGLIGETVTLVDAESAGETVTTPRQSSKLTRASPNILHEWRLELPPPTEWQTIGEYAIANGLKRDTVRFWVRGDKMPSKVFPCTNQHGSCIMIKTGTPIPANTQVAKRRARRRKVPKSEKEFRPGGANSPRHASDRDDFAARLERVLDQLDESPGDAKATVNLLAALEDRHSTVGLATRLGLNPIAVRELCRTGRTSNEVDVAAYALGRELLAELRSPVEAESIDAYAGRSRE